MFSLKNIIICSLMLLSTTALHAQKGLDIGDEAPDFSLLNVDGKKVSMSDYEGAKGLIVVFTCNHCPFSIKYEDRIVALDEQYKPQGYPVLAINPNDAKAYPDDAYPNMQIRAKEKGFTFPYLHDETQKVAQTYGASRTPHVYLLQKEDDKWVVRYIGAIDDDIHGSDIQEDYVSNAVESLLKGIEIAVPFTKAVGCSIKWK